jgi:alpha/beta superfamily hydrolase
MNSQTQKLTVAGPAGLLECLRDAAQPLGLDGSPQAFKGVALIAHPHPLFGGTMDNKVVQTMARAFVQAGWDAVRFNFRGVGRSEGSWDEGRGELADFLAVLNHQVTDVQTPLAIAGFSFGAFVASHAIQALSDRPVQRVVLVGTAASRFAVAPMPVDLHPQTLVLHGEQDDTVPLTSVLDWARPQALPVTVVPGVEHFFHGQLPLLKRLVLAHV